jgi:SH3-like domain-containing protein
MIRRHWTGLLMLASIFSSTAWALEYRSVLNDRTVMYDTPSLRGKKLYLASRYYPVEVIVSLEHFAKVRDAAGDLAWVEKKQLGEKRMVLVNVPLADVRQAADEKAPLAFQAERNVVLELLEYTGAGWLKIRHPDGAVGFVRISQVWGA